MWLNQLQPINLEIHGVRLPEFSITTQDRQKYKIDENEQNKEILRKLCEAGFSEKLKDISKDKLSEYRERLDLELDVLEKTNFRDYILLVWDVINFANKEKIPIGFGRGSVGGSLVAYLLGITNVDPIEHGLFFERFVSETRAKSNVVNGITYIDGLLACDIDLDFCFERRKEVIAYLEKKYEGRFCKLPTYSTLQSRALIKDVGKIYSNYSEEKMKEVSAMIPSVFGKVYDLDKACKESNQFAKFAKENPDVYRIARKLHGLNKAKSSHASAFLISHDPLDTFMPCETGSEGEKVAALDMYTAAILCIKLDLLGLQSATLVDRVCKRVGVDKDSIPTMSYDDVYGHLQQLKYPYGLFQISGDAVVGALNKMKPANLTELSNVIAIARPGSLDFIDDYVKGVKPTENKDILKILHETRGIVIYQESLLRIGREVFGLSGADSESLRRATSKKKLEEVKPFIEKIRQNAQKLNISQSDVDFYVKVLHDSASYSFNKCLGLDTLVETESGNFKKMSEVSVGEKIKAYNTQTKESHFVQVIDIIHSQRELFKVKFSDLQEIECSLEHKFLTTGDKMMSVNDLFWYGNRIITDQTYSTPQIVRLERLGWQKCIDFEVDHPDHNFYANGLVTSNSHSVAYSMLSAATVWCKFAHPKEFFLESLKIAKEKSDFTQEFEAIQRELPHFGIKLLPPDILKSELDFKIEPDGIRYGLSDIKGISGASIDKIRAFVNRETANKFEVFAAAKEVRMNVGVFCALLMCGALSSLEGDRAKLVLEAQVFFKLNDKERLYCLKNGAKFNYNLIDMVKTRADWIDSSGKKLDSRGTRLDTIRKECIDYFEIYNKNKKFPELAAYWYEKNLLGYSYSQTLKKVFSFKNEDLLNIHEINEYVENKGYYQLVAEVVEVKEGTSKAGNSYLRLSLADETGLINAMILGDRYFNFAAQLKENGHENVKEGDIVYLRGQKGEDILWINELAPQTNKIYMKLADLKKDKKLNKNEEN